MAEPVPETFPEIIEPAPAAPVSEAITPAPPVAMEEPTVATTVPQEQSAIEPAMRPTLEPALEPALDLAPPASHDEPIAERRHPLRFVWHMDADGRFGVGSDEFIELVGPRTMAAAWPAVERHRRRDLKLDPDNQVARAIATHETWSGIVVSWPVDDFNERLPVELSGLPVFDRDRSFRGYRGFGVCRDIERINDLARERRERAGRRRSAAGAAATRRGRGCAARNGSAGNRRRQRGTGCAEQLERPLARPALTARAEQYCAGSANVVPFRQSQPTEPKTPPPLSPVERRAFRELAQELTSRLRGSGPAAEDDGAEAEPAATPASAPAAAAPSDAAILEQTLLDRIPIGILVYRHDSLVYANRHFLEWSGYESRAAIEESGGLNTLFAGPAADARAKMAARKLLDPHPGRSTNCRPRAACSPCPGTALRRWRWSSPTAKPKRRPTRRNARSLPPKAKTTTVKSILDTVADGIVTLDPQGRIADANARAAALFGKSSGDLTGRSFGELFAPESDRAARDYFDRVVNGSNGTRQRARCRGAAGQNRLAPLALTIARLGSDRFAAMFHDTTLRRQSEEELRNAKREAAKAAAAKTESWPNSWPRSATRSARRSMP